MVRNQILLLTAWGFIALIGSFAFTTPSPLVVQGAWSKTINQEKQVLLVSGDYFSSTAYAANSGAFFMDKRWHLQAVRDKPSFDLRV